MPLHPDRLPPFLYKESDQSLKSLKTLLFASAVTHSAWIGSCREKLSPAVHAHVRPSHPILATPLRAKRNVTRQLGMQRLILSPCKQSQTTTMIPSTKISRSSFFTAKWLREVVDLAEYRRRRPCNWQLLVVISAIQEHAMARQRLVVRFQTYFCLNCTHRKFASARQKPYSPRLPQIR